MSDLKYLNERYDKIMIKLKESKVTLQERTQDVADLQEKRNHMEKEFEEFAKFR